MPEGNPQPGEFWLARLLPGGTRTVRVVLRATAHDLATMPDSTVAFVYLSGYPDPARVWTLTLRNFLGMYDYSEVPDRRKVGERLLFAPATGEFVTLLTAPAGDPRGLAPSEGMVWDTTESRWKWPPEHWANSGKPHADRYPGPAYPEGKPEDGDG